MSQLNFKVIWTLNVVSEFIGVQGFCRLLADEVISEFGLVVFSDLAVEVVHWLLLLVFLFALPDHLVAERVVVRLLVHLVVKDTGFSICDLDAWVVLGCVFITNINFQEHIVFILFLPTRITMVPHSQLLSHSVQLPQNGATPLRSPKLCKARLLRFAQLLEPFPWVVHKAVRCVQGRVQTVR